MASERARGVIAVVVALVLHALIAMGLALAQDFKPDKKPAAITVDFKVAPEAPRGVTPDPGEEPEPEEEPKERKAPVKELARQSNPPKDTQQQEEITPEDLAPGEASDEPPAEEYTYKMDGLGVPGTMAVARGRPTGNLYGTKKGKGDGKGGGGDENATGTRVATVASIKTMPRALGDNDFLSAYKYPPAAREAKIEGRVSVYLLISAEGEVTVLRVIKGLGYGLDAEAKKLAKRLRFEPAKDEKDRSVAVRITWSFDFTLPE